MLEDETRAAVEDYHHAMGAALVSPEVPTIPIVAEPTETPSELPKSGVLYTAIVLTQANA